MTVKYDLPESQIDNYLRYQQLFVKKNKTQAELDEFSALELELSIYKINAQDWNNLNNRITQGESGLNEHKQVKATTGQLGHVKQGIGIEIDSEGVVSAKPVGSLLYSYRNIGGAL